MRVIVMNESGIEEALEGLALSYNSKASYRVADKLAHKGGGHNKFLESISVWIDITASRTFWTQFDTYRVGTTKQSESTMHTILRKQLSMEDFEGMIYPSTLKRLNRDIRRKDFDAVIRNLPQSFLQRRMVCTNYKVLQNMYRQRKGHKLKDWAYFLDQVPKYLNLPEWVTGEAT